MLEGVGAKPRQVAADLGYRGMDAHNLVIEIIHRGRHKSLTWAQRLWLKRRQAVEPVIGHLKAYHRLGCCWLQDSVGDALHTVLCALQATTRDGCCGGSPAGA
jgi:IS5 family transposase